jgi:hypothetical protein
MKNLIQAFKQGREISGLEQDTLSNLQAGLICTEGRILTRNPLATQDYGKLILRRKSEEERKRTLMENVAYVLGRASTYFGYASGGGL